MLPTLTEVLALPALVKGEPRIVAGAEHLSRPVRWVHISELSDIADLLQGGELILTTGIALPESPASLRRYVAELVAVGAAAIAVELGRRYEDELPASLVAAATEAGLPLVELRRETSFVAVTEAVHALIVDAQMEELVASEEAHRAFTELTIAGSPPEDVVHLVATMAARPVVYENLMHQVLAYDASGADPSAVLDDWEQRSRAARLDPGAGRQGWLVVAVGARGADLGRLVMLCGGQPSQRERMLLERGATALVMHRLIDRNRDSLERQTHRTLLTALATASKPLADTAARARALGVPLDRRRLTAIVVRPAPDAAEPADSAALLTDVATTAAGTLRGSKVPALVGPLDDHHVAVLLAQPKTSDPDRILAELVERLHAVSDRRSHASLIIGAGCTVDTVEGALVTLQEALQVADTAVGLPRTRSVFRLSDLRLRGLVYLLRDEPRVQTFVELELGPLLAHDAANGTHLYDLVAAYCRRGGNKSAAAAASYISRPALYERLAKIEKLLGVDLTEPETLLSMHFAVLARETMRRPTA